MTFSVSGIACLSDAWDHGPMPHRPMAEARGRRGPRAALVSAALSLIASCGGGDSGSGEPADSSVDATQTDAPSEGADVGAPSDAPPSSDAPDGGASDSPSSTGDATADAHLDGPTDARLDGRGDGSGDAEGGSCDSTSCAGCCAADGTCHVTTDPDSMCGTNGAACADCTALGGACGLTTSQGEACAQACGGAGQPCCATDPIGAGGTYPWDYCHAGYTYICCDIDAGLTCGGGGTPWLCGCGASGQRCCNGYVCNGGSVCTKNGACESTCGGANDLCCVDSQGNGTCTAAHMTCGGAGDPSRCGCTPSCTSASACGATDGCGGTCDCIPGTSLVLFGGFDTQQDQFADTWTWDGSVWTQQSPATGPAGHLGEWYAAATLGGRVVYFDGSTWLWDGARWFAQSPAASPPSRRDAAMATLNGNVVLFGGFLPNSSTYLNDTWIWNGATWTLENPGSSSKAGLVDHAA